MKKDIRIPLIVLGTIASSFLGSSLANATLFPVGTTDLVNGVYGDDGKLCDIQCITTSSKDVTDYINSKPEKAVDKFFNATYQAQYAILAAYNKEMKSNYTIRQAQQIFSDYMSGAISGSGYVRNGTVVYNGLQFNINNGTFAAPWRDDKGNIQFTLGVIDKDLNFRISDPASKLAKGNLRTTTGITSAVIDGVVIDLNSTAPTISSFTASPTAITAGQSSTLSWASNGDKCILNGSEKPANGTMIVSPIVTTNYEIACYKGSTASTVKNVTLNVTSASYSGSTTNPYASTLSTSVQNIINTWITKNITSRSTTLSSADYSSFVETIIGRLNQIKSATPASNINKLNVINYLVWELQNILNNSFFDGLFN